MFERRQGNLTFDRSSFTLCLRFVSIFIFILIFGASKRMQTVSLYTDVVIFFLSFFVLFENPKTLRRSMNPPGFFYFYHARSTDFKKENRWSVNRLANSCNCFSANNFLPINFFLLQVICGRHKTCSMQWSGI